jgi:hypothetical protein
MLDNEATSWAPRCSTQQYAGKMTGLPGGLSDAIARQLERQIRAAAAPRVPLRGRWQPHGPRRR